MPTDLKVHMVPLGCLHQPGPRRGRGMLPPLEMMPVQLQIEVIRMVILMYSCNAPDQREGARVAQGNNEEQSQALISSFVHVLRTALKSLVSQCHAEGALHACTRGDRTS